MARPVQDEGRNGATKRIRLLLAAGGYACTAPRDRAATRGAIHKGGKGRRLNIHGKGVIRGECGLTIKS